MPASCQHTRVEQARKRDHWPSTKIWIFIMNNSWFIHAQRLKRTRKHLRNIERRDTGSFLCVGHFFFISAAKTYRSYWKYRDRSEVAFLSTFACRERTVEAGLGQVQKINIDKNQCGNVSQFFARSERRLIRNKIHRFLSVFIKANVRFQDRRLS